MRSMLSFGLVLGILAAGWALCRDAAAGDRPAEGKGRVFELRTYHTAPGRLDALNKRFRDHTCKLFQKHGIELVGFWTPAEGEGNTLIYIVAFPSREAQAKAWKAFQADPDWKKAKAESEKDGPIVVKVESRNITATDYSPIK